jgi:hypothetical protein
MQNVSETLLLSSWNLFRQTEFSASCSYGGDAGGTSHRLREQFHVMAFAQLLARVARDIRGDAGSERQAGALLDGFCATTTFIDPL